MKKTMIALALALVSSSSFAQTLDCSAKFISTAGAKPTSQAIPFDAAVGAYLLNANGVELYLVPSTINDQETVSATVSLENEATTLSSTGNVLVPAGEVTNIGVFRVNSGTVSVFCSQK